MLDWKDVSCSADYLSAVRTLVRLDANRRPDLFPPLESPRPSPSSAVRRASLAPSTHGRSGQPNPHHHRGQKRTRAYGFPSLSIRRSRACGFGLKLGQAAPPGLVLQSTCQSRSRCFSGRAVPNIRGSRSEGSETRRILAAGRGHVPWLCKLREMERGPGNKNTDPRTLEAAFRASCCLSDKKCARTTIC